METTFKALSAQQLDSLCRDPFNLVNHSPVTDQPLILLDLLDTEVLSRTHQMLEILPSLPCPVIAIAPSGSPTTLTNSVDVVVSSHKAAQPLIRNILDHPLAAMTLVQLLRHNEHSSLDDGLLAESLAYATLQASADFRNFLASRPPLPIPDSNPEPAVLLERQDDILHLTLNRPQQRNAYSTSMRDALFEGLALQAADSSISRTIIRGAGACFCTGGALEEFGLAGDVATAHAIRCSRHVGSLIAKLSSKIECHLHKACIGSGIELPAFAGHVVAKPGTFFHLPEITMGLIPGAGGTVSIVRRIGRQRTTYLALSAKRINTGTALEWGLIDAIV
ncbi:MAG: enoyl-CoA hydratase/isomerase family protein [Halieaceae bacterium]|jgi:enoyl-CoA hydratase|nr:enoyl-CoA hydratase/isomerase family protein [Halieaceae bacterium]